MGWFGRLRGTIMRSTVNDTLDDEVRFHLDSRIDEYLQEGMTLEQAQFEARRRFGSVALAKERARDADTFRWVDDLRQDIRHSLRVFQRHSAFTIVAVFTLSLGIGATTAIFSVVHAVLLQPLPYPDANKLIRIYRDAPRPDTSGATGGQLFGIEMSELMTLRAKADTLSHVGVQMPTSMTLMRPDGAIRLDGTQLSPAVLQMLGVHPRLGRIFEASEEVAGSDAVVILSHAAWQQHFGSDPTVIGRRLVLDGRTFIVIGVMAPEFRFPDADTHFWIPFVLRTSGPFRERRYIPIARVKPGVSLEASLLQVRSTLERRAPVDSAPSLLRRPLPAESPQSAPPAALRFVGMQEQLVATVRPMLWILSAAVGAVLLIACVNVAGLLLARTSARGREIAVRLALGCGRGRLVRQGLTETALLALVGGVAGVALAWNGVLLL